VPRQSSSTFASWEHTEPCDILTRYVTTLLLGPPRTRGDGGSHGAPAPAALPALKLLSWYGVVYTYNLLLTTDRTRTAADPADTAPHSHVCRLHQRNGAFIEPHDLTHDVDERGLTSDILPSVESAPSAVSTVSPGIHPAPLAPLRTHRPRGEGHAQPNIPGYCACLAASPISRLAWSPSRCFLELEPSPALSACRALASSQYTIVDRTVLRHRSGALSRVSPYIHGLT
jgi:hypothetical protein